MQSPSVVTMQSPSVVTMQSPSVVTMQSPSAIAMEPPSLVFIGEGNILLTCLHQTVTLALEPKAVFTNTPKVQRWCAEQRVPFYKRSEDLEKTLANVTFDYLMSVNNPRVLKEGELRLARRLNVNYHDSLLPAYAGVNASAWAILHGERRHGVTLHVIEVGIDSGHILEQEEVEVLPTDSALSLNLRCLHAFHIAFRRLLTSIASSTPLTYTAQNLSSRSYYGLNDLPPNMGVLSFIHDFATLYSLARALQFGHQENLLGSPKILTSSGRFLLVTDAEAAHRQPPPQDAPAGRIVQVVDDTLIVQTTSQLILLSVAELDGSPISAVNAERYALTAGALLQSPSCPPTDLTTCIRKKEAFWRRIMQNYEPTLFLRQKLNQMSETTAWQDHNSITEFTLPLPSSCPQHDASHSELVLLSSFIFFLGRVCSTDAVHVGLLADKCALSPVYQQLYADVCPAIFNTLQATASGLASEQSMKTIEKLRSSLTFLNDMVYRYPELRERRRELRHNLVVSTSRNLQQDPNIKERVLLSCNLLVVLSDGQMTVCYITTPSSTYQHIFDNLKHFGTYLSSLSTMTPHQILRDVQLLSAQEMATLYPLPNVEDEGFQLQGFDLYALFEQQSRSSPSAVAVRTTSVSLTYRQLEEEVLALVNFLVQHFANICTEKRCICLHVPNSASYVISLVACLKLRCPFLPVPADQPVDRVLFTLHDARATAMITTKDIFNSGKFHVHPYMSTACHKTPDADLVFIDFDTNENNMSGELRLSGEKKHLLDDCCYVMYTSGSTGRPKGVQVRSSGVVNMALAQIKVWDLGPEDVTAQFASIGFDASVSEILTALLSGGVLAVLYERQRLGQEFVEVMASLEVTVVTLPPSVLSVYCPRQFPTLRKVVTAGEACTSLTAVRWTEDMGHGPVRFFNAYGPTETTVCATVYEVQRDLALGAVLDLPIGNPIHGVVVYLLDDNLRPVPPHVVGEIYIGGAGVAGGYIGNAVDKNASRFIPNPLCVSQKQSVHDDHITWPSTLNSDTEIALSSSTFALDMAFRSLKNEINSVSKDFLLKNMFELLGKNGSQRVLGDTVFKSQELGSAVPTLYKTGDHAFQDNRGCLTFVGRLDDQIKIRGQRVDLSEIEQLILQYDGVEMAVVVKHRCCQTRDPSIAAFVAPVIINTSNLKEHLSRSLPKYMIPTFVCKVSVLDLPVASSGKINRQQLETDERVHDPDIGRATHGLSEEEEKMAVVWCQVLGLEESYAGQMHRLTSFAELGGSSLHLVLLQRKIEDAFHVHLSFIEVGSADTIQNFIDVIKRKKDIAQSDLEAEHQKKAAKLRKILMEDAQFNLSEFAAEDNVLVDLLKYSGRNGLDTSCTSMFGDSPGAVTMLISGATGFLGVFVLGEVLARTSWRVVCLVRDSTETCGMQRVVHGLQSYGLWRQHFSSRLAVVLSNISQPNLGLDIDLYTSLSHTVDIVFINAATMNFNADYHDHRKTNVLGTRQLLHFALQGKRKLLFFTSSLSVLLFPQASGSETDRQDLELHPVLTEADWIADPLLVEGGYGQSKWVSERLVLQVLDHLPGGAVFRPARISGHSDSGKGPDTDLFATILRGVYSMGTFPDLHFPFDLTPVDFCASAILDVVLKVKELSGVGSTSSINRGVLPAMQTVSQPQAPLPRIFHLFNNNTIPFSHLFHPLHRALPLPEWRRQLLRADNSSPLLPFVPFFLSPFWDRARRWPIFDTSNTDALVSQRTARMLRPSADLLTLYKAYFRLSSRSTWSSQEPQEAARPERESVTDSQTE